MTYDDWVNTALSRLNGAVQAAVTLELDATLDDFCRRSTGWRETVRALNVTAGDRNVLVQIGDGTDAAVGGILRVYYNQMRLVDYSHVPFEVSATNFGGYTVRSDKPDTIQLSTIPTLNQTGVIDAWVWVVPLDVTALPDVLLNQYHETILDGLLTRMYSHQNRPYTNDGMALAHQRKYSSGITRARDQANRGFTGNAQNWTFPPFGR